MSVEPGMNQDPITLQRIQLLHPDLREEAVKMYAEQCAALTSPYVRLRYAYTLRTNAEQDALFAQGRTKPGKIVTWARGGDSYHNYGLAYDIVLLIDRDKNGTFEEASWDTLKDFDGDRVADWMEVVAIAKKYKYEWGGDWPGKKSDKPHFQKTFGFSIAALKKLPKLAPGSPYPKLK